MTEFGKDTSCTDELRPGQLVTGKRLLAEAIYRRLTTPRGTLLGGEEEADYGIDLLDLVGSASSKSDLAALPGRIQNELLKDPRIDSVSALVTSSSFGPSLSVTIEIDVISSEGPFDLQLSVNEVSVELLRLE